MLQVSPPLAKNLAEKLAKEMGMDFQDEDLAEVYSAAKNTLGDHGVVKLLEKCFKHCTPSNEYDVLVKYPFFRIYSLNIDDGLENAAHKGLQQGRYFNVKRRFDSITEVDQFYRTLDYIKLNGDINAPRDGFIFSSREYAEGASQTPAWYEELGKDFFKFTFVFIGTQLREPMFYNMVETFRSKTQQSELKSYLLVPSLTPIQKQSFESSKIEHIPGSLKDFTDWLESEFSEPPLPNEIVKNVRPELLLSTEDSRNTTRLFADVTPVSRASLSLAKYPNQDLSQIKDFYKGFKPTWKDITDGIPVNLSLIDEFFNSCLSTQKPKANNLFMLFGAAGCGKSTALKQLAIKIADEGERNVYFLEGESSDLRDIVCNLDERNSQPYYVFIDRIGSFAKEIAEILKKTVSTKVVFVSSANPKIWNSRVREHLDEFVTNKIDISSIREEDVSAILEKLKLYGNWTRLEKMSLTQRRSEIYKKSKQQLLIGLIEATSGEGYNQIIQKDYAAIENVSERGLLILAGLATTRGVQSNEATLTRALSYAGLSPNVAEVCKNLTGIVSYKNGNVSTRHRTYIERLFENFVTADQLVLAIKAYIKAFSVYSFPVVQNISRNEGAIYKHLVNNKNLKNLLNNDKEKILGIYREFEKVFENEGLFLMQYGLALRSFGDNSDAYEKLKIANLAYPESPHIEHALAQQRIIMACKETNETICMSLFNQAYEVLERLNQVMSASTDTNSNYDRYPIITLSEGHVRVLLHLGDKNQARVVAREYYNRITKALKKSFNQRLDKTAKELFQFSATGNISTLNQNDDEY